MAQQKHSFPNRLPKDEFSSSDANYTAIRYGNDHGAIRFGHIHEKGDVTSSVLLQAQDGRQMITMDETGHRRGWTSCTAPGNFSVRCGEDNDESMDTLFLNSLNGNIVINAQNGKIRMQATDIELLTTGEGTGKGNIRIDASENLTLDAKQIAINAKTSYRLASPGKGEVVANAQLEIYGSVIRGVTDACTVKDSKNNQQRIQQKNTQSA
jgi:hypothetical protein